MASSQKFTKVTVLPYFQGESAELVIGLIDHPKTGWQIVGGSAEIGESPLEAARRELWEETGLAACDQNFTIAGTQTSASPVLTRDVEIEGVALRRGYPLTIVDDWHTRHRVRYTEFRGQGVEKEVVFTLPSEYLALKTTRHFFAAEVIAPPRKAWRHPADGHVFSVRFFPLSQLPHLLPPFDSQLGLLQSVLSPPGSC